ncbi:copper homeostasis protein cutC-like protein [Leptotrombidium deliense]|uniref:Copper homeostasis protein cutC homolog n=1 Tax=Leptotrombidium deliense TaxID=299467 RepID=A0A443S8X3_9ACAR|nr:copper homeostasis protein cutC-like protein [Leptotrombidium deliense]
MPRLLLEICIDSVESAKAAIDGGADRLEVCSALAVGGLTPSLALLKYIRNNLINKCDRPIELYAMIRPRDGDFCYTNEEIEIMQQEIVMMINANLVDGFVFGLLRVDGTIDRENCSRLMRATNGMAVTFHRAFDVCCEPFESLETVIELGFKRVLTSGQMLNAADAIHLIAELVKRANNRIIIMPGSGINRNNLHSIAKLTNAIEFHSSASIHKHSSMQFMNQVSKTHFNKWKVTETNCVRTLSNILTQNDHQHTEDDQ